MTKLKKYAVHADNTIVRLRDFVLDAELNGAIGTILSHIGEGDDLLYRVQVGERVLRVAATSLTVVDLTKRTTAEQYLALGYSVENATHIWSTRDTKFLRVHGIDLVQHLRERLGATLKARKPKPHRNYDAFSISVKGRGRMIVYQYHGTHGKECAIKIVNGGRDDTDA